MRLPRALVLASLVSALLLALPGTAAAAGDYPVRLVYNYCGGANDNQVHLKMRISARGHTNANTLSIASWAQRRVDGRWETVYRWDPAVYRFEIDGDRHTLAAWRQYNGTNTHKFRIVFRLSAAHDDDVLRATVYRSVAC